jgi:hypothetical protein
MPNPFSRIKEIRGGLMKRPTRVEHFRWLGDKRNQRVYDLDNISDENEAVIDELIVSEQYLVFGPDSLAEARNRGYRQRKI